MKIKPILFCFTTKDAKKKKQLFGLLLAPFVSFSFLDVIKLRSEQRRL